VKTSLVAAAFGLVTNLVSNFLAPKAEKRQKLLYGIFAALIGLLIVLALMPDAPNQVQIVGQRAYISVVDADLSDLTGDIPPTVAVNIKNTGQSPAYDLSWRATFAAREVPVTEGIPLDRKKKAATLNLPPGGTLSVKWTFTEWEKGWNERIAKGSAAIFAIGEISYKDAYGVQRFTKYRLIHGGGVTNTPGKFGPDMWGNESD
jgi:hypothetical protein